MNTMNTIDALVAELRAGDNYTYAEVPRYDGPTWYNALTIDAGGITISTKHRAENDSSFDLAYGVARQSDLGFPVAFELADWMEANSAQLSVILEGADWERDGNGVRRGKWTSEADMAWTSLFGGEGEEIIPPVSQCVLADEDWYYYAAVDFAKAYPAATDAEIKAESDSVLGVEWSDGVAVIGQPDVYRKVLESEYER